MPRNKEETEGLSLLGNKKTVYKDTYAPEVLETFVNKHQGNDYMVTFDCPRIYVALSNHRSAGFCKNHYQLYSKRENG